jgi:hypothetical protein
MEKKILFRQKDGDPVTRVANGEYGRDFDGAWPQEATEDEWQKFLFPTGLFVEVEE